MILCKECPVSNKYQTSFGDIRYCPISSSETENIDAEPRNGCPYRVIALLKENRSWWREAYKKVQRIMQVNIWPDSITTHENTCQEAARLKGLNKVVSDLLLEIADLRAQLAACAAGKWRTEKSEYLFTLYDENNKVWDYWDLETEGEPGMVAEIIKAHNDFIDAIINEGVRGDLHTDND